LRGLLDQLEDNASVCVKDVAPSVEVLADDPFGDVADPLEALRPLFLPFMEGPYHFEEDCHRASTLAGSDQRLRPVQQWPQGLVVGVGVKPVELLLELGPIILRWQGSVL